MPETYCPNCDADIRVSKPRLGATVICSECGMALEIISADPFEVDFPFDEDEDEWEEEEEEA